MVRADITLLCIIICPTAKIENYLKTKPQTRLFLALGLAIYDNLVYNGNKTKRQYVKAIAAGAGNARCGSTRKNR